MNCSISWTERWLTHLIDSIGSPHFYPTVNMKLSYIQEPNLIWWEWIISQIRFSIEADSTVTEQKNWEWVELNFNHIHLNTWQINTVSEHGLTPLMLAAIRGDESLARVLLDAGADVDAETPTIAGAQTHPGAYPNPETQHWTALTYAAIQGQLNIAKLLLEHGANVEGGARLSEDKCTETPLQVANFVLNSIVSFHLANLILFDWLNRSHFFLIYSIQFVLVLAKKKKDLTMFHLWNQVVKTLNRILSNLVWTFFCFCFISFIRPVSAIFSSFKFEYDLHRFDFLHCRCFACYFCFRHLNSMQFILWFDLSF